MTMQVFDPTMSERQCALVDALVLAITAPSDAHAARCEAIYDHLAAGLTLQQLERCKEMAVTILKLHDHYEIEGGAA